jgi:predicted helicase
VSNAGWLDGNSTAGLRQCLAEEFSKIYVFNLRGDQRTSGELSHKEGGKIFGSGSRTPIAITILIKKPEHLGQAEIYHYDIGDYLPREEKLSIIAQKHDIYSKKFEWQKIVPNEAGDWLNKRTESFENFVKIGDKDDISNKNTFFIGFYSNGLKTQRDSWCYNSSSKNLRLNIVKTLDFYTYQRVKLENIINLKDRNKLEKNIDYSNNNISWSSDLINSIYSNVNIVYDDKMIINSLYRPFFKQKLYFNKYLNERTYQIPKLFPTQKHENLVICVPGPGGKNELMPLITNCIPDLHLNGDSQCFPRYYYEEVNKQKANIFSSQNVIDGYTRHDAITDFTQKEAKSKYGPKVNKDDIFYFVYGFLHSGDYRTTFSADLKKMLPRLPLVEEPDDFWAFSKSGRDLAELHLNYETVKPYDQVTISGQEKGNFLVDKIRFVKKDDKTTIQYNSAIKISGIPQEAYDYVVNGRSAIEWILDRYQVKVDKDSGIKNDPNDWAKEHDQPRYILDLILRVITVSLETMKIVKHLPKLDL